MPASVMLTAVSLNPQMCCADLLTCLRLARSQLGLHQFMSMAATWKTTASMLTAERVTVRENLNTTQAEMHDIIRFWYRL
jgi:hypothetical protein